MKKSCRFEVDQMQDSLLFFKGDRSDAVPLKDMGKLSC